MMTRFQIPLFSRFGALALALVYTLLTFGAALSPTPAYAAAKAPYYTAELAAPAKDARAIAGGVVWHCKGTTCAAAKANTRDERVCRKLVREVGTVTTFTAEGEAMADDKLATCNGE